MSIRKFSILYTVLIFAVALIFWSLDSFVFQNSAFLIPHFWVMFGYMAGITLLVYALSVVGIKKGGDHQGSIILAAIVLHMLLTLCFVLFYVLKVRVNAVLFIANFFSIYLLFTVFEIYCLLCNLRHQIKK